MDVSLCVSSYRPGGLDLLFESLADMKFDGKWECIFSDELYQHRKNTVTKYVGKLFTINKTPKSIGDLKEIISFKHVPAVPHEFTCPASTMNTSVRHSSGELILIVGDYSIYASDYLQKHWDFYKSHKDATLVSSYMDLETPEIKKDPKVDDYSIFKEPITKEEFLKREVVHPEERHHFVSNWLDTKLGYPPEEFVQGLISLPREFFLKINGFDEDTYNAGKGYSDRDVVHRAMLMGWRFVLDLDLRVYRCAHPHKKVEDLKWPFTEKKNYRTREENFNRFVEKTQQLSRRHLLVNSHKGIRDLQWLNEKRILVQGGGAEVCTRKWVKILQHAGLPVYHNDMSGRFMFRNITTIIVYGCSPFDFSWTMPYIDNSEVYMFWTGTDAHNVVNGRFGMEIPEHPNLKHLAVSDRLKDELAKVNISATTILDYEDDMDYSRISKGPPEKFMVTVYMPGEIEEPYNFTLMKEVAEALPDITFNFFGNKEPLSLPDNCIQSGYVLGDEKIKLYEDTSIYLRCTRWDGFPYINLEFQKIARQVICDYPYPFCHVAKTKDEIVNKITEIRDNKQDYFPNWGGSNYYRKTYSKENFIKNFIRIIWDEDCLKKWEGE